MFNQGVSKPTVTVAGHPFSDIGMGTHVRGVQRSLMAARVNSVVFDIYGTGDASVVPAYSEFRSRAARRFDTDINIFCLNGDEIGPALQHHDIKELGSLNAYNIVYPMWELPNYPEKWVKELDRFDEVWAPSKFVEGAISTALGDKVRHMPIACEMTARPQMSRRAFGVPEDAFVFLMSFDFSSYMDRKNPFAALEAFRRMRDKAAPRDAALVIKVKNGHTRPEDYRLFKAEVRNMADSLTLIDRALSEDEMHALVSLSDAYLSLHRSEGFGLGMAESMCVGRPSVCTGWSGNMDFCDDETTQLVDFSLIPVRSGQYPFWQGQQWADADIDDAAAKMLELANDPELYARKSLEGRLRMRRDFSHLATGLRYADRLRQTLTERAVATSAAPSEKKKRARVA